MTIRPAAPTDSAWSLPPIRWSARVRKIQLGSLGAWLAGAATLIFAELILTRSIPSADQPALIVGGFLIATFLAGAPSGRRDSIAPVDLLLSALVVGSLIYRGDALPRLLAAEAPPTPSDLLAALALTFAVVEAGRRTAGWPAAIGVGLWAIVLMAQPFLPGPLVGEGVDARWLAMRLFLTPDGPFGAPIVAITSVFLPAALFAGAVLASDAVPVLAAWLGRIPRVGPYAGRLSDVIAGPFVLPNPTEERRLNQRTLGLGAIVHLAPPILGAGPLLAAALIGVDYPAVALALLLPALLALTMAAGASDRPVEAVPVDQRDAGLAVGPIVMVVLLVAGAGPGTAFLAGAALLVVGALVRRPAVATVGTMLQGGVWSARIVATAGGLTVFLGLLIALEGATGVLAQVAARLAGLAYQPIAWSAVAFGLGAALVFPAAAALLAVLTFPLANPVGAVVAGLCWAAAGSAVVNIRRSTTVAERLIRALPLVLTAIVVTRSVFGEGITSLVTLLDSIAAIAICWGAAGPRRVPLLARILLVAAGVLLFIPRPEAAIAGVAAAVGAVVLISRR